MERRELVVLDVEGTIFKTRICTLTSVPGAYFARLFSGDWKRLLDKEGQLFIDRDATLFRIILNFLRDGPKIPLPSDEYLLRKVRHEADHYGLFELIDRVEKKLASYSNGTLKRDAQGKPGSRAPPRNRPPLPMEKSETSQREEKIVRFGSTPVLIPLAGTKGFTSTDPVLPRRIDSKTVRKADSISQISLPRNFAHVAHVGWNGDGIIFEKHLLGDGESVRKIIAAAQEPDLTPIYNVINGDSADYGSHSLEVVLAGPHMQSPAKLEATDDRRNSGESPRNEATWRLWKSLFRMNGLGLQIASWAFLRLSL
ncbi:unnamed protein product, partial [Mesorhabditis spiculigera]